MPPVHRPGKGLPVLLLCVGVLLIAVGVTFAVLDARLVSQTGQNATALHTAIAGVREAFRAAAGQLADAGGAADAQATADALFEQNLGAVLAPLSALEQALVRGALFALPLVRYRWALLGAGLALLGAGLMLLARRRHGVGSSQRHLEAARSIRTDAPAGVYPTNDAADVGLSPAPVYAEQEANATESGTEAMRSQPAVCMACGAVLRPGARFCNACGEPAGGETLPGGGAWPVG